MLDDSLDLSSKIQISQIESWHDEPLYIESMAALIEEGLRKFSDAGPEKTTLLYSAHSIPAGNGGSRGRPWTKCRFRTGIVWARPGKASAAVGSRNFIAWFMNFSACSFIRAAPRFPTYAATCRDQAIECADVTVRHRKGTNDIPFTPRCCGGHHHSQSARSLAYGRDDIKTLKCAYSS